MILVVISLKIVSRYRVEIRFLVVVRLLIMWISGVRCRCLGRMVLVCMMVLFVWKGRVGWFCGFVYWLCVDR